MAFELLEEITVTATGGQAALEFANIPQDGDDLLLMCSGRMLSSGNGLFLKLNNATSGYMGNRFQTNGTSISATETGYQMGNTNNAANAYGAFKVIISRYAASGTGSEKQYMFDTGQITPNSTGRVQTGSVNYSSQSAITNVQLTVTGTGWAQHTVASLYKITAS